MIIRQTLCWTSEMETKKIKVKCTLVDCATSVALLLYFSTELYCIVFAACQLTNPPSFEALAEVYHTLLLSCIVTFDLLQHRGHAQAHIWLTPSPTGIS